MDEPGNEEQGRPRMLTILCVLTFVFTGLGCLSAIITPVFSDILKIYILNDPSYNEALMADTLKLISAGWAYYLITLLFTLGSMLGAILMWRLHKIGFHFYASSNLAILFVPTLMLDITISGYAIFFAVAFILMYAMQLKFMK